jgi:DNA-binding transcriptional ArsR family regulator/uncharacterized protein YndB with AHSA1/START domain
VTDTQRMLDALAYPARREILWRIWDDEAAAGAIAEAVGLTAGTVSTHLAALHRAGLVTRRAVGTFRYYRADRDRLRALPGLVSAESTKWLQRTEHRDAVQPTTTGLVVETSAVVSCSADRAFACWTDARLYSRWLGVEVQIVEGRFSATMEFGRTIRGFYDIVVPNQLIAFRWDFATEAVPLPGSELQAYLRFTPVKRSTMVQLHQLVSSQHQVDFMRRAWSIVFSRFGAGYRAALRA